MTQAAATEPARLRVAILLCVGKAMLAMAAAPIVAQEVATVRGRVLDLEHRPIRDANVIIVETLEGDLSDDTGGFSFRTNGPGTFTLVTIRPGFITLRLAIDVPLTEPLTVVLSSRPVELPPITVTAGAFAVGPQIQASLTSLDVVTTPGSAADVLRALATFPGVQAATGGAGLFVRGGDVAETKVILDGATVIAPYRFESSDGDSFGAFDPFILDGISFASGGFGVRNGDALSGLVELETAGRPGERAVDVTGSLAALSAQVALPINSELGATLTGTRTSTDLLFRLNGIGKDFVRRPEGRDLSGNLTWDYGESGRLKLFAITQTDELAVNLDGAASSGAFHNQNDTDLLVLSGRHSGDRWSTRVSLSTSGRDRDQDLGVFRLSERDRFGQARGELHWSPRPRWVARAGAEAEHRRGELSGSFPERGLDSGPDEASLAFASTVRGTRVGWFLESDWRVFPTLQVTSGLRDRIDRRSRAHGPGTRVCRSRGRRSISSRPRLPGATTIR